MPLPEQLQKAITAILSQPGETGLSLRRAILEQTRTGAGQLPDVLRPLVEKITLHPWALSDEDFAQLRAAGYSDGQLFEVTLAAALGAGLRRFDAGLRALGESP